MYISLFDIARELTETDKGVSTMRLNSSNMPIPQAVQKDITKIFGKGFTVQNRYEQQAIFI